MFVWFFGQVCAEMGVEAPVPVSMKLGDLGNLFRRIVNAAQRPHMSIPETKLGRQNKINRLFLQRSITAAAGKSGTLYFPSKDSPINMIWLLSAKLLLVKLRCHLSQPTILSLPSIYEWASELSILGYER